MSENEIYTGYLLNSTQATVRKVCIYSDFDELNRDPLQQMHELMNGCTLDLLRVRVASDLMFCVWYHRFPTAERVASFFHFSGLRKPIAGRAVVFQDDGMSPTDSNASPFGITPQISIGDFSSLIVCVGFHLKASGDRPRLVA
jgi:hypothetical protein